MAWSLVLVPLAGALGVVAVRRRRVAMASVAVGALVLTLGLAVAGAAVGWTGGLSWGPRLGLTLDVDGLTRVMVVLVPAIAAPVVAYAAADEREDPALPRLVAVLVAFVGAMELLVAADDLLTLLLGWELVAACSWALIAHRWREPRVTSAATQAFVVTGFGALGLYLAAGAAFASSGSVAFGELDAASGTAVHVMAAGVLIAAAAKSAQLPFSPWLFAAMEGPTPVSALLHSATMVAAGAYAVARLGPELVSAGWLPPVVAALGAAAAIAGGLVTLGQRDLKRALAASTTSQYGLVFLAAGAGFVSAAGAQLMAHAAFKALLFLAAGVAIASAGGGAIDGIGRRGVPRWASVSFGVGVLALAGLPPLGGAFPKGQVVAAGVIASPWLGAAAFAAGLLSAMYGGRLFLLAFARVEPGSVNRGTAWALGALIAATAGLGVLGLPAIHAWLPTVTGGRVPDEAVWQLAASLALVAAGFVAVAELRRRGALLAPLAVLDRAAAAWLGLPTLGRVMVVDPVLAVARGLAAFDDRVIDAGVRAVGRLGDAFSRLASWWGERGMDGVVGGVAGGAFAGARSSRTVDERAVDAAVEGLARGVGIAGAASRRLQTGLAHRNYVLVAAGVVVVVAVAVVGR